MRPLPLVLAAVFALCALVAGCDQRRIAKLEEGVSTEADVRKQFGEPVQITQLPDGSRRLDYPRQPEGTTNYAITIGPDGKMSALRQLLTPANFAKVRPGMAEDDLLQALGRPARSRSFAGKPDETVVEWRFQDGAQKKVFEATLDRDHRVLATAIADDPREALAGK